jgi:hypothetical protein
LRSFNVGSAILKSYRRDEMGNKVKIEAWEKLATVGVQKRLEFFFQRFAAASLSLRKRDRPGRSCRRLADKFPIPKCVWRDAKHGRRNARATHKNSCFHLLVR